MNKLENYFAPHGLYQRLFESYAERGVITSLDPQDKEYNFSAAYAEKHYFDVGADALRIMVSSLCATLRQPPETILDFPSGSGRVTRHLRSFFPGARIVACDLYDFHIDFCRSALNVEPFLSKENIDEINFGKKFDLIFCGSLLTHLPKDQFLKVLRLLAASLSDTGIAIVTLQGRHSQFIQKNKWKYLEDDLFEIAATEVNRNGFGYVDYDRDFKSKFDQQMRYGVALVNPSWVTEQIQKINGLRVLSYTERQWDDHQDVVVFGRPDVNT
jgi:SAM-dependent methyltransferase